MELADDPPEAGSPALAHTETATGATHVPEEELTDVMLELFEEGSLTELLEDDTALQEAIQRSTRQSGRSESSDTPARAKAKAKSEATSSLTTSRKPVTVCLKPLTPPTGLDSTSSCICSLPLIPA